jgi:hypothetical protein
LRSSQSADELAIQVTSRNSQPKRALAFYGQRSSALATGDAIERTVAEIRHVTRVGTLALALDIGEIVFRRVFGSDVELVRRNGPKDVSFSKLAAHPDLPLSRASLWRAVALYELSLRVPRVKDSKHLGVSHLRAVLGLPARVQERLLTRAERQRWKVAELEAEATSTRRGQGGRPPKLEVLRALDGLMRVASLPLSAFGDRRAVEKMSREDVECAVVMLTELDERLIELKGLLQEIGAKPR